jgi:hypothetical protein
MNPPNPQDVGEMARLIRMMNEGVTFEDDAPEQPQSRSRASIIEGVVDSSPTSLDPSVAAMKSILEAFNGTGSPADALADRSVIDRELREALITEATQTGTRIGSWEIIVNENDQGLKSFDVTNVHTGEPIATDLSLYDAAHGIVRALNEGLMINSSRVRDILSAESEYERARQNAAEFRERGRVLESRGDQRAAVMEDRFDVALSQAKDARSRLMRLAKL